MRKIELLIFTFLLAAANLAAQAFVNGDLEGKVSHASELPNGWQNVSKDDPVCKGNTEASTTPDLTNEEEPDAANGIIGKPFSGSTFVSGLHLSLSYMIYQEGIQQTLKNLVPGKTYQIIFYQCVVKQENARDTSGSWIVYCDETSCGITPPSHSRLHYDDVSLIWEERTVVFKALKTVHTIKFLPYDDDNDQEGSPDKGGGLRMGIDHILLLCPPPDISLNASSTMGYLAIYNDGTGKGSVEVYNQRNDRIARHEIAQGLTEIDFRNQPAGDYLFQFQIDGKFYKTVYKKED